MPFKKQDKNINRPGRTTGTPNKTTKEIKELLRNLFSDNLEYIANYTNDYTTYDRLQLMKMLLPYVVSIEKTQAEHIEQPLFPDIDTSDLIDKKEFDVRDLFRIDKYEQGTRTDLLSIVDKKLEQEKEQ
mgnify:CR=1 FL=1